MMERKERNELVHWLSDQQPDGEVHAKVIEVLDSIRDDVARGEYSARAERSLLLGLIGAVATALDGRR